MWGVRELLNRAITTLAWWLADWLGWRAALAVYPPLLANKVAIVSGANAGLGLETTKALLQQGATVIMACRSLEHGHTAREDILKDRRNHGPISGAAKRLLVLHLDLEDMRSIRSFVDEFHSLRLPLHVLVNNGGVHLKEHKHVTGGFERTLASDYFGHVYLTHLLLGDLKASAPSRVVNVASVAEMLGPVLYTRTIPWDDLRGTRLRDSGERPYTLAKTWLLMANTRELARRLEGTGVDVVAVHPGIADSTWYLRSDSQAYTFSWVVSRVRAVAPWIGVGQPVGAGAISSIYAAVAPEVAGTTSVPASRGLVDAACRVLFGGRLVYYGPSYFSNLFIANLGNAGRRWVVNPWCYNRAACARLYEASLDVLADVEGELGLPRAIHGVAARSGSGSTAGGRLPGAALAQQDGGGEVADGASSGSTGPGAGAGGAFANGSSGRSGGGGLKQRARVVASPAGDAQQPSAAAAQQHAAEALAMSAAAQPLKGA